MSKKPNGTMYIGGQHAADCFVYITRKDAYTMNICVRSTPLPMTKEEMCIRMESIEKKYSHAILVLQAISQRSGANDQWWDEWSEAEAFRDCREAARKALKYLGEPTSMPNKSSKRGVETT